MTEAGFNAAEVGFSLAKALDAAGIPYAIGGALAYGVWALPRATKDVDINIFLSADELGPALDVLASEGVKFERDRALSEAANGGFFEGWVGHCRIDVFTPSIPFSMEAARTRVLVETGPAWFLSAEALAFFKLMFFRGKDIVDLERLIVTMGKKLDAPYVRRWMIDTMGEDDVRVKKWDELCALFWRDARG